jgi:hypothetical protein
MTKAIEFVGFSSASDHILVKLESSIDNIKDWKSFSESLRKLSEITKSYQSIMQQTNAEA